MLRPPRGQSVRPYGDAALAQPVLPGLQLIRRDGEGDVNGPAAVVRRDDPARHLHRREGGAAPKQQEHARGADGESVQALVGVQRREPQDIGIEPRCTAEIIDVQRSLENMFEAGHRG